jgi:hypothetical protein
MLSRSTSSCQGAVAWARQRDTELSFDSTPDLESTVTEIALSGIFDTIDEAELLLESLLLQMPDVKIRQRLQAGYLFLLSLVARRTSPASSKASQLISRAAPHLRLLGLDEEAQALCIKLLDAKLPSTLQLGSPHRHIEGHDFCRYQNLSVVHRAVLAQDTEALELARQAGMPMDDACCQIHGVRPLGLACGFTKYMAIVSILLESGADPDPAGPHVRELQYPLHSIVGRGNLLPEAYEIVERLILAGSNVNVVAANYSPLYLAAQMNDLESARRFIRAGATLDFRRNGDEETTVLSHAAYHGLPEIIRLLLDFDVDVLVKDTCCYCNMPRRTPLHMAACFLWTESHLHPRRKNEDLNRFRNAVDILHGTTLHNAILKDDIEAVDDFKVLHNHS